MAHDTPCAGAMKPLQLPPIAGAEYIEAMSQKRSDRQARTAFTRYADSLVAPAGRIFDFGCGPGIDARLYASLGHAVLAYDVDPRMLHALAELCREELQSRRVTIDPATSYEAFLRSPSPAAGRMDLVTANFAPLNLVENPAALFIKFDELLAPGGRILASVLNPQCLSDARYGWWWWHLAALARRGHYVVGQGRVHRRTPAQLLGETHGRFRLARVVPASGWRDAPGWAPRLTSRYLFLLFERA